MNTQQRYQALTQAEQRLLVNTQQAFNHPMSISSLTALQKEQWRKLIYYEIKRTSLGYRDKDSYEEFMAMLHVVEIIGKYTPREFMQIFPADKTYLKPDDGWKDYFYTMNMIQEQGTDELIKEPYEFLIDYMNTDVRLFTVRFTTAMSHLNVRNGGKSLLTDFFGLEPIS